MSAMQRSSLCYIWHSPPHLLNFLYHFHLFFVLLLEPRPSVRVCLRSTHSRIIGVKHRRRDSQGRRCLRHHRYKPPCDTIIGRLWKGAESIRLFVFQKHAPLSKCPPPKILLPSQIVNHNLFYCWSISILSHNYRGHNEKLTCGLKVLLMFLFHWNVFF